MRSTMRSRRTIGEITIDTGASPNTDVGGTIGCLSSGQPASRPAGAPAPLPGEGTPDLGTERQHVQFREGHSR